MNSDGCLCFSPPCPEKVRPQTVEVVLAIITPPEPFRKLPSLLVSYKISRGSTHLQPAEKLHRTDSPASDCPCPDWRRADTRQSRFTSLLKPAGHSGEQKQPLLAGGG
ncbi:hypothetical protein CB1_002263012 [Camelus ferus]|nr:hypothetical protein CB1_002263012 [Camelus ferus]